MRGIRQNCHYRFVAYLLTFNCYGSHLRGDERGSVDRVREARGGAIEPSRELMAFGERNMTHAAATLDLYQALAVLNAVRETCSIRHWTLLAAHARSTHIHIVADGISDSRSAIRDFKSYASRALNREGARRRWARGGNARLLRDSQAVRAAIRYVVEGQGQPMAVHMAPEQRESPMRQLGASS